MLHEYDSWNERYKNDLKDQWIAFTPMENETCESLHQTKWKVVLQSRKNVLKACVLMFVKTLGSYTKNHSKFVPNFRRKRLPSTSRRLMYLTWMLLLLRRGTVSIVSAVIRTFSNQGYSKESGSTLRSSAWPKSLQPSNISEYKRHISSSQPLQNANEPNSLTLKTGKAPTFETSK
jgi:hypothetical protein